MKWGRHDPGMQVSSARVDAGTQTSPPSLPSLVATLSWLEIGCGAGDRGFSNSCQWQCWGNAGPVFGKSRWALAEAGVREGKWGAAKPHGMLANHEPTQIKMGSGTECSIKCSKLKHLNLISHPSRDNLVESTIFKMLYVPWMSIWLWL